MKSLGKTLGPWLPWVIGVSVLVGGYFAWTTFSGTGQAEKINVEEMTTPVIQEDITVKIAATGTIKPLTPVNVSPKQPGRLLALYVDQGALVKKGEILARMDNSNLQGQLLQAQGSVAAAVATLRKLEAGNRPQEILQSQANVRDAQAQVVVAQANHNRNVELIKFEAVSRSAFDASLAQLNSAQARLRSAQELATLSQLGSRKEDLDLARANVLQAQGALKSIQTQVNDTVIRAPFAGIVTQKFANVGAFVTPTTTASATNSATSSSILALAGNLEAVINVAESDIRQVYVGQKVNLKVDAFPDQVFAGKVRLVAPEGVIAQNVTSFEVRVAVTDPKRSLRSGMNLNGEFIVGEVKGALLIPTAAIVTREGGTAVLVYDANAKPEGGEGTEKKNNRPRRIKVGAIIEDKAQVLSGLKLGDRVFTTFPNRRRPNDRPPTGSAPFGQGGAGGGGGGGGRPPR